MVTKVKVSAKVRNQIPAYQRGNENLVGLLKSYYEFTEQPDQFQGLSDSLDSNMFVDYADDAFLQFFINDIIPNIPVNANVDPKVLIHHAKEFYQSKGSEDSFRYLFKYLFNSDVAITYPKVDIFRLSDGIYSKTTSLTVLAFDPSIYSIPSRRIIGLNSGATGIVDSIVVDPSNSNNAILTVQNVFGSFIADEPIKTESGTGLVDLYCRVIGNEIKNASFVDDRSMLSSTKRLQDGEYYQEFSYVLSADVPTKDYALVVDKLIHPSGTRRFGYYHVGASELATNSHTIIPHSSWMIMIKSVPTGANKSFTSYVEYRAPFTANGNFLFDGTQIANGSIAGGLVPVINTYYVIGVHRSYMPVTYVTKV
ncbi:MAG: hypothetical protein KGI54_14400 [Pseudomonadota bacterium]|nr:hypothetical protein [Pseudomonadota bacterium]